MKELSKKERDLVDQTVLGASEYLFHNRDDIYTMHWDKPQLFSKLVCRFVAGASDKFDEMSLTERHRIVRASITRLRGRKQLRKKFELVPVMKGMTKLDKTLVACYWPTTILEEIARLV